MILGMARISGESAPLLFTAFNNQFWNGGIAQPTASLPGVVPAAVDLIFVARNLERIGDHATNIAEDVVFLVKGIDVRRQAEDETDLSMHRE
jgi:phosphate uptake regulator